MEVGGVVVKNIYRLTTFKNIFKETTREQKDLSFPLGEKAIPAIPEELEPHQSALPRALLPGFLGRSHHGRMTGGCLHGRAFPREEGGSTQISLGQGGISKDSWLFV